MQNLPNKRLVVVVDAILPKRSCQHARAIRRIVVVVDAILPKRSCQRSIVVVEIKCIIKKDQGPRSNVRSLTPELREVLDQPVGGVRSV